MHDTAGGTNFLFGDSAIGLRNVAHHSESGPEKGALLGSRAKPGPLTGTPATHALIKLMACDNTDEAADRPTNQEAKNPTYGFSNPGC